MPLLPKNAGIGALVSIFPGCCFTAKALRLASRRFAGNLAKKVQLDGKNAYLWRTEFEDYVKSILFGFKQGAFSCIIILSCTLLFIFIFCSTEEDHMITEFEKYSYRKKLTIAVAFLMTVMLLLGLYVTKPYAVYADGTKVEDPYVVKAGNEELFLVEDKETAEEVIASVMEAYAPDGAQINSIVVDKKICAEDKTLERGGKEPPLVLTEGEAVSYILEKNSTDEPLFSVTINAETGSVAAMDVGEAYEETEDMYVGDTQVKSTGTAGSQVVTNQVTSVNGVSLTSTVVDTTVLQESTDTVIYKGIKEKPKPKHNAAADYKGHVMGSGNGAAIASYAVQFAGNPYVAGGTSPENGADCSGFTQAIYSRFGISLPRTSGQQAYCGKGVSLSEAKAGDLVCYSGHVAIYMGGGKIIHASTSRGGIKVSNVHDPGGIITVRRIVE